MVPVGARHASPLRLSPNGAPYEMLNAAALPDWHVEGAEPSRAYGEAWQQGKRSLILIVPRVVARVEKNILINPEHSEFAQIGTSLHQPVWCDERLFKA